MANVEDQQDDMDQQRIDDLQNQYFRDKLATVDAKRLQEAREYLERNHRPAAESAESVRPKAITSSGHPQDNR